LIGTTFWPFAFAHRALCAAAILARAAALIFRRGLLALLYGPENAAKAAFNPDNRRATLSRSAFNSKMMSI
jgi:hypothetical protein